MVGEDLKIYGVQITGKYISKSKNPLEILPMFTRAKVFPRFLSSTPLPKAEGNYSSNPSYFPNRKGVGEEIMLLSFAIILTIFTNLVGLNYKNIRW